MNVCCALLWPDLPEEVAAQVMEYVRFHPSLFSKLMDSYANEEAALFSGVVLRSFFRYGQLVETFLTSGKAFELIGRGLRGLLTVRADGGPREATLGTHVSMWRQTRSTPSARPCWSTRRFRDLGYGRITMSRRPRAVECHTAGGSLRSTIRCCNVRRSS